MKKLKFPTLSRVSMKILKVGLAPVALTFIYIAFAQSSLDAYDTARLFPSFLSQLEHAVMSLTLVICGALLKDMSYREQEYSLLIFRQNLWKTEHYLIRAKLVRGVLLAKQL